MLTASITSTLTHQVAAHGVYATFVLMAIDAVFPAGSELVMLYAGALAAGATAAHLHLFSARLSPGVDSYLVLAAAGTLGYLAGALVGWWIGRVGGIPFVERHGRLVHLGPRRFERAQRWFDRFGAGGVLVGRVLPLVRSFVSIPAGVFGMSLGPYVLLTLIGSAIWAFALAGLGYAAGSSYGHVDHALKFVEYAVVALVAVGVAAALRGTFRRARSPR